MVDQVADLHPPKSKFRLILINSYSESSGRWGGRSTCHSPENGNLGFILIDCHFESSGRPGGRSSGRCNPPWTWWFEIHTDRFLLWELRQIRWQIYPPGHGDLRFIMIDSYSESSGRQDGRSSGRSRPPKKQVQIDTDKFLLWELRKTRWQIYPPGHGDLRFILIDSYSESSGRSGGKSTPLDMVIWQIHTDRFLLWELRQTRW